MHFPAKLSETRRHWYRDTSAPTQKFGTHWLVRHQSHSAEGVWCRSARTLLHKIANRVLVSIRVRVSFISYFMEQCTCTSTPDPCRSALGPKCLYTHKSNVDVDIEIQHAQAKPLSLLLTYN